MSDDKYLRATESVGGGWWPGSHGRHKVVPADAIVIERGDLPEVTVTSTSSDLPYYTVPGGYGFGGTEKPEWYEGQARNYLAIAECLRANPPVDEEQVKALAEIALTHGGGTSTTQEALSLARHLVARGVRVEVEK